MKMRNQNRAVLFAAATAAVAAMAGTHLSAAEVYWKGGGGNLDVFAKKWELTYR